MGVYMSCSFKANQKDAHDIRNVLTKAVQNSNYYLTGDCNLDEVKSSYREMTWECMTHYTDDVEAFIEENEDELDELMLRHPTLKLKFNGLYDATLEEASNHIKEIERWAKDNDIELDEVDEAGVIRISSAATLFVDKAGNVDLKDMRFDELDMADLF